MCTSKIYYMVQTDEPLVSLKGFPRDTTLVNYLDVSLINVLIFFFIGLGNFSDLLVKSLFMRIWRDCVHSLQGQGPSRVVVWNVIVRGTGWVTLGSFETEINPLSYEPIVGNSWETPKVSIRLRNFFALREARLSRLWKIKLVTESFGQNIVEIILVHYHHLWFVRGVCLKFIEYIINRIHRLSN